MPRSGGRDWEDAVVSLDGRPGGSPGLPGRGRGGRGARAGEVLRGCPLTPAASLCSHVLPSDQSAPKAPAPATRPSSVTGTPASRTAATTCPSVSALSLPSPDLEGAEGKEGHLPPSSPRSPVPSVGLEFPVSTSSLRRPILPRVLASRPSLIPTGTLLVPLAPSFLVVPTPSLNLFFPL